MDAAIMSHFSPTDLPAWAGMLFLTTHLAAGFMLGLIYFEGVWWNARLFAEGRWIAAKIALALGRFLLLTGTLALTSLEGALPLLLTSLGVLVARPFVMRCISGALP
jgi:F1F0 ATPase subunit 2